MPDQNFRRFFISIVLPSILAVGFIILLIFQVILPSLERNIMEGKKETISELTNTVWSLLEEFHQEVEEGDLSANSAMALAAERIRQVRYGDEYKDYFWIIDHTPEMIMHPYRPELIGEDLSDYRDPEGKLLFVESVRVVREQGAGYIDYMWQWKDDSTRIVPKLSYVKEFEPWDWVIGTGIYLEDVREEIRTLQNRLLRITLLFTLLVSAILAFIIRQSLSIENRRRKAEQRLRLSRQKYKSLVEASTEGTLMILHNEIIFANVKFSNLSGYDPDRVRALRFSDLFTLEWENLVNSFADPGKSLSVETRLKCEGGQEKDVVISASRVSYASDAGYIIIVKEVSPQQQMEKEKSVLSDQLQTALVLMNQAIGPLLREVRKCEAGTTVGEAAKIMARKERRLLFVSQGEDIAGVITMGDLNRRVLAAGLGPEEPVGPFMSSPVVTIRESALLYEALLVMRRHGVSHLASVDNNRKISGVLDYRDILSIQMNTISFMIKEIESADSVGQLAEIYRRLPVLVSALIESGDRTGSVNRIITSVSDAMHERVIRFALEDLGEPPAGFAFMVMGSEGRREQTLATDQDNAIVFEDVPGDRLERVSRYFLELGVQVNRDLHTIGYHYCRGDIMARNPQWTQPLSTWRNYFSHWIHTGNPKDVMEAAIFFDFRNVYGRQDMVDALRVHVNQTADNKAAFFHSMAQEVLKFKPPVNIFGNIVADETRSHELTLDIKRMMMPVVAFIRLYAIVNKLTETNSMERLELQHDRGIIDRSSYEELSMAYDFLMRTRLKFQVDSIRSNELPDNVVEIQRFSRSEITTLKKIFSGIGDLQSKISFDFKAGQT